MTRPSVLQVSTGQKFGRLTVVDPEVRAQPAGKRAALCHCDCGTERVMRLSDLITRGALSCGCLHQPRPQKRILQVTAGQRFGRLLVLDPEVRMASAQISRPSGWRAASCQCDCGNLKDIRINHLLSGQVLSCGCLVRDTNTKHGLWQHPLYMTWALMMDRCYNSRSKDYPRWGGRGVYVHSAWHDVQVFITWIEDNLGPRPGGKTPGGRPEYTLDRENPEGNYEPGNVRWASNYRQVMNTRKHSAYLREADRGKLIASAHALRLTGLSPQIIADQLGIHRTTVRKFLTLPIPSE